MSVDFFTRSKMSAAERGVSDSVVTEPVPKTQLPTSAEIQNSIHWTKEQLEDYIRIREKYDREGLIRETAARIMQYLPFSDGNLSAGACARWSVMAAVALLKYSKEAAEDERAFWTDEDGEETYDYFYGDGSDDDDED